MHFTATGWTRSAAALGAFLLATSPATLARAQGAGDDALCEVGEFDGQSPAILPITGERFSHDPTILEEVGS